MNYSATPRKRIPSDIFTDSMQLTLNKGKAAANQSNQSSEYQKKQEIKKSTANIIAICNGSLGTLRKGLTGGSLTSRHDGYSSTGSKRGPGGSVR